MDPHKGKAATKAKNKYNAQNYDSLRVVVPKGRKAEILAVAEAAGDSLNSYVSKAVEERMGTEERRTIRTYTIIGGVNGTGKSSFTGVLTTLAQNLGIVIDVDKITAAAGVTQIEGGRIALRRIRECLEKGVSFTQETTLSGYRAKNTVMDARARGYYIRLFYICLDTSEECLKRIENRVARGGHSISADDVLRRFAGRWDAIRRILPLCDEARFFDNDNGFVEVAEYRSGKLTLKGDAHPAWTSELVGHLHLMEFD